MFINKIKIDYFIGVIAAIAIFIIEILWTPGRLSVIEQNNYLTFIGVTLIVVYFQIRYKPQLKIVAYQLISITTFIFINGELMSILWPTSEPLGFYEFLGYGYFNYVALVMGIVLAVMISLIRILFNNRNEDYLK